MKQVNWTEVEETNGDYEKLPSGGYVCQILRVEDITEKEYLKIEFDICDGKYKDYFTQQSGYTNFWGGSFIKSYKDTAIGFFKGMLTAIEKSNSNFSVKDFEKSADERMLIGKHIGLTIGQETYWNSKGEQKSRPYVSQCRDIFAIKEGKFKVPEDKVNDYNKPKGTLVYDPDLIPLDNDCPFTL